MIETERLLLKHYSGTDQEIQDMLNNWISDPAVQSEYGESAYTAFTSVKDLVEKYRLESYRWAVWEKKSKECIGQIAFCKIWDNIHTAEIEYCIGRSFQGNGYAGEALNAVVNYTFTHTDFEKLEAFHRKENPGSGRVLVKSPMHPTDTVERFRRQEIPHENEICYCITAREWREKNSRMQVEYRWTDGEDEDFHHFYFETEAYYSSIVGGAMNRQAFIPYNLSESVSHVIIASVNGIAVGCAGLKPYSDSDAEVKRVWVKENCRRNSIANDMMNRIEEKAMELGFRRTILQTRLVMKEAVALYLKRGYQQIDNYPPYDKLDSAVCFAKILR